MAHEKQEPVTLDTVIHRAIFEASGDSFIANGLQARKLHRHIVSELSRAIGSDTLRSEIVFRDRPVMGYQAPYRPIWTPKEREFRLACRAIDAQGFIPTNTRIAKYLKWPEEKRRWGRDNNGIQINGRESAWRIQELVSMGYTKLLNDRWWKAGQRR